MDDARMRVYQSQVAYSWEILACLSGLALLALLLKLMPGWYWGWLLVGLVLGSLLARAVVCYVALLWAPAGDEDDDLPPQASFLELDSASSRR